MDNVLSSPATLAFVGDAYFSYLVRVRLAEVERPIKELHSLSVKYVNANSQALGFEKIKPQLTEDEMTVFKRGRNLHTKHTPKNSTVAQYHMATGLECLFGYYSLSGETERAEYIFDLFWQAIVDTQAELK